MEDILSSPLAIHVSDSRSNRIYSRSNRIYHYPGFQFLAVPHYMQIEDAPPELGDLVRGLREDLRVNGRAFEFTQTIGTLYRDGKDNIGWHSDKMRDIADDSLIFDVSLGARRTFSLRRNGSDTVEEYVMEPGSAILLTRFDYSNEAL